jgi:Ca2+-binding EF-hand superfamily protein
MTTSLKIALLLGVVTFASGTAAGLGQAAGPMQGLDRTSERGADRLLRQFDLNKDGRLSHDEMNRTIGATFAAATHHAPKMTIEQFMVVRAGAYRAANEAAFRRLDWNGDGKLTLAEFVAPTHLRFVSMDREGKGYVWCATTDSGGRGGLSHFCTENDADMDGRLDRSELDTLTTRRFAKATGGGQTMALAQFVASEQDRFAASNARTFRRLDADGDGGLTIAEFADAELKLFARLDKNKDGVLAPSELKVRTARAGRTGRRYD